MKAKEEQNARKEENKTLNKDYNELNGEELEKVSGGEIVSSNVVGYSTELLDNTFSE